MDLNQILIWTVCISCIALLVNAKQISSSGQQGWLIAAGGILLVVAIAIGIAPQMAGYSGGLLWFVFIFFPLLAQRQIQQLVAEERYLQAARRANFWRWFHPIDGWWEQPQIFKALALAQQGDLNQALHILNRYQSQNHSLSWVAIALLYRMNSQWEELLNWMQRDLPPKILVSSPDLMGFYLRSLGETGNLNLLLQEFRRLHKNLAIGGKLRLDLVRMTILAFSGDREAVNSLFQGSLQKYPASVKEFWLATAEMAQGNEEIARDRLAKIQNLALKSAIDWRLQHVYPHASSNLTRESWHVLQQIKTQIYQEDRYGGALNFSNRQAVATYGLIAINCLMFVWETVAGGNESEETLYRLGALVPSVVWDGEWWRLLSATFLHYGILHLSMNMLGLYFLGVYVESSLGITRYLSAYFFSGIGSMLVVTLVAIFTQAPPQITVGASGAIMGMVGALTAILLRGWAIDKAPMAAQRLRSVLFIIGLQIAFDLTTPQVSFLGHISGLVLGFGIAAILVFLLPKSRY